MTTEPNAAAGSSEDLSKKPIEPASAAPPVPGSSLPQSTAAASEVSPSESGLPAWLFKVDVILLCFLLMLSFLVASFVATNADVWMSLAIGRRLSEGEFQFGVDPFSWASEATASEPAAYWIHHGWLYSWLLYQLYSLVGGPGLVIIKASLFTLSILLLSRVGWKDATRWFLVICLAIAALAISPRLLLDSSVLSFLFLSITMVVLDRAGLFGRDVPEPRRGTPRILWLLPPLFALWANLDVWFILGPLLVGLCWLGAGLSGWFGLRRSVPGATLGLVFAAGLLACLINPHHVHIFQLPPELAYVLLSTGLPLPNALAGGGRTLQIIRQAEPDFVWTISTVSERYWKNPNIGLHIAGIAVYPLFLMGLFSFTLSALIKPQPGAPTFQITRFLIWTVFAMMAISLYRLIPFFAIVAAPLTAMTLGEFLEWQTLQTDAKAGQRDRGLRLARVFSVPFMMLMLFLAWAGWLHGTTEFRFNSARHVAWDVWPDESQKAIAQSLHFLHQKNECGKVFNVSLELPGYCAWFAPGVKCAMDTRLHLFANQAERIEKARQALREPLKREDVWRSLLAEMEIAQLAVVVPATTPPMPSRQYFLYFWFKGEEWRERHGDLRMALYSRADPQRSWAPDTASADWNRAAFGAVPADSKPPLHGTPQPQHLDMWTLYLHGTAIQPAVAKEARMGMERYAIETEILTLVARPIGMIFSCAAAVGVQGLPGGGMTAGPTLVPLLHECNEAHVAQDRPKAGEAPKVHWSFVRPMDLGPPALPLLAVREARRAVAENRQDPLTQGVLLEACEQLRRKQEDYWVRYQGGPHPARLRDRMRQTQYMVSVYNLTQTVQTPLDSFRQHYQLANLYRRINLMDFALEQMQQALRSLELFRTSDKDAPKGVDAEIKQFKEQVDQLAREVGKRQAKWLESTAKLEPLEKAAIAFRGPYEDFQEGKAFTTQLGLGRKAMEILDTVSAASLTKEEFVGYIDLSFDLLLLSGRASDVLEALLKNDLYKRLPPTLSANYQLLAGGALGDYASVKEGLLTLEKGFEEFASLWAASMLVAPSFSSETLFSVARTYQSFPDLRFMNDQYHELFNAMTLRGIVALEAGETQEAREIFGNVLTSAGTTHYFSERPIAQRYFDLLSRNQK